MALNPSSAELHTTTTALDFTVTHQRTFNPNGVLSIALAMPAAVGALLLV